MNEQKIVLNSIEGAQELADAASKCSFDVKVCNDTNCLDAKSMLNILSFDLRKIIDVKIYGFNADLDQVLCKYAVN